MVILAPWDESPSKRIKEADFYVDMRRVEPNGPSEDVLFFIREKNGDEAEDGHLFIIRPPKCHVILLSGVDPKFGIKLDERRCIHVRN